MRRCALLHVRGGCAPGCAPRCALFVVRRLCAEVVRGDFFLYVCIICIVYIRFSLTFLGFNCFSFVCVILLIFLFRFSFSCFLICCLIDVQFDVRGDVRRMCAPCARPSARGDLYKRGAFFALLLLCTIWGFPYLFIQGMA